MDLNKLTTEQINGYSAAEGVKALETLRQESLSPMQINEALLMKILEDKGYLNDAYNFVSECETYTYNEKGKYLSGKKIYVGNVGSRWRQ